LDLTAYLIIPIIGCVFCIGLLTLLIIKGRQHVAQKPFGTYLGFMTLWCAFIFMMRVSPTLNQAAIWEIFVFFSILSAAISFYWFTLSLTGTRPQRRTLLPLLLGYAAAIVLVPTGLIFNGMQMMWYGKAPVVAPLFPLYVLCVYVPIALGMMLLIKQSRRTRSTDERTRNQYIIAGIIAMLVGGTTDYLPALGLPIYPLGIIGNIAFCLLTTVAMLKYGLLEIRVVMRAGAAYSLVSILIFGLFGSFVLLTSTLFKNLLSPLSLTITITAVFLVAAIFQPVLSKLQRVVDRWFFSQRYDYLQALKKFAYEKEGDLDINQLSMTLVTTVAQGFQSSGVYLLLPSSGNKNYITQAYSGNKKSSNITFAFTAPLAITLKYQDKVMDSYDVDIIPSLGTLAEKDRKMLSDNNIDLIMPLKKEDNLVGILLLSRKITPEPYNNEEKQLLNSVSAAIATRVDNAARFETVIKANSELQKTMDGVIFAISAVVESRDPYTAGHQRRVAELARAIAGELGFSEYRMKGMHIMGLLHDVGKTAVPAEILSKPGKISQYEFNIIKNHSRIGFEILEKVEFPWPVAQAVLQHHERVNGTGYPDGLRDKDIIVEARILSVADVVEAMSSHRPYRPAVGLNSALKEIQEQAGILYDREVVEACLRLLQNSDFAFEKLMTAANPKEAALIK
jgi:putative nucleotidyltransferase with HDIG domain